MVKAGVGDRCGCQRKCLVGGLRDCDAVLAPLVGERSRAGSCDSKGRGGSCCEGQREWLDADRQRFERSCRAISERRNPPGLALDVINSRRSIIENVDSSARRISHEVNARQLSAAPERRRADSRDVGGDRHARQPTALVEHPVADGDDAGGDRHAL